MSFYSPVDNIFQRTFSRGPPCRRTTRQFLRVVSPTNTSCSSRNSRFEHFSVLVCESFVRFACTLSTSQNTWSRNDGGSPRSTIFINFFHMGAIFCFLTHRHSQFGTFSHPSPHRTSSNCFYHERPASGSPYKFGSRSTTGSSMFDHDLGHLMLWKTFPCIWTL